MEEIFKQLAEQIGGPDAVAVSAIIIGFAVVSQSITGAIKTAINKVGWAFPVGAPRWISYGISLLLSVPTLIAAGKPWPVVVLGAIIAAAAGPWVHDATQLVRRSVEYRY